jgi:hypothetical protein
MDDNEFLKLYIEIAKLIVTIFGGLILVWYWNSKKNRQEKYQYLDSLYNDILKLYFENPQFGEPELTANYRSAYVGEEFWRYHYFAMHIHTFLESIFDMSKSKCKIMKAWEPIYKHHKKLHSAWLQDNKALHEEAYCLDEDKSPIKRIRSLFRIFLHFFGSETP